MSVSQSTHQHDAPELDRKITEAEVAVRLQKAKIAGLETAGKDTAEATERLRELLGQLTELVRTKLSRERPRILR